jgi:2-polyprenyl-6-methoxyphenol hydroxylase-like FAD-dependent oxidoreductase
VVAADGDGSRTGVSAAPVDVLIAGAGPTGLTLALQALAHGARVRIVERRREAFRPSRALIMHPRTLEVLRPLGVTEALLARSDASPVVQVHLGRSVVPVRLHDLDLADSSFPHMVLIRQTDVETVLWHALADRGVQVERGVELVGLRDGVDDAHAVLRRDRSREEIGCRYLAGCDGPDSTVRRLAGIGWRGGPYRQEVVLADLELEGLTPGSAHAVPGRRGLLFLFPIGENATWRLLGTRPATPASAPPGQPGASVPAGELQHLIDEAGVTADVTAVAWSAQVALQHRIATRHSRGRLFLAGDAAHAHSPAAAQGMNSGIQDAANLGWKLAFAASVPVADADHSPGGTLLESYTIERRPVARQVLAMTHAVFWAEAGTDPVASLVRRAVSSLGAPFVPLVMRQRRLIAEVMRVLSQMRVSYRHSPLSVDAAPHVRAVARPGERLPDATVRSGHRRVSLHELVAGPGLHVLLQRDAARIDPGRLGEHVATHRVSSWPGTGVLLVRPDGYVGLRTAGDDTAADLDAWLRMVRAG